jgi:L1 cell adhesion molecule
MPAILVGVLAFALVIVLLLTVVFCLWRQRAKAKENAVKMTMVLTGLEDNEPLRPTNVKPNLAKLRIVKEAEMRKGGILGYGAFGTVFKVSKLCNHLSKQSEYISLCNDNTGHI